MFRTRVLAVIFILFGVLLGSFIYYSEVGGNNKDSSWYGWAFKLGLDLKGGTYLVYKADTSKLAPGTIADSMSSLREVIERRVNLFGVSEPVVQNEQGSMVAGVKEQRLIVELPGVADVAQAVAMIGSTPVLEFKTERPEAERKVI